MVFEGRHEANHWQDPDSTTGRPLGARKHYGAWRWRHWNRGSPRNLDWWSSPPRRRARTASPARSGNGPDGTTSIPASPRARRGVRLGHRTGRRTTGAGHFRDVLPAHVRPVAAGAVAERHPSDAARLRRRTVRSRQHAFGAFDIAMFGNIPGLTCLAPTSGRAFLDMLAWSTSQSNTSPVVIRVPGDTILNRERSGDLPGDAQDVTDMGSADDTCSNACSEKTTADGTATCRGPVTARFAAARLWRSWHWATRCRWDGAWSRLWLRMSGIPLMPH